MFSVCARCSKSVVVHDRPPPWCPHCGEPFSPAARSVPAAAASTCSNWSLGPIGASSQTPADRGSQPTATPTYRGLQTVTVQTRDRHHCSVCGCVWERERSAEASGIAEESARLKAQSMINQQLRKHGPGPCPCCGLAQPEQVIREHLQGHGFTFALAAVALFVVVIIGFSRYFILPDQAGLIAAGVVGLAGLFHLGLAFYNPNRFRGARMQQIAAEMTANRLAVIEPGDKQASDPARLSIVHLLALLALIAAPVPFLMPWWYRMENPIRITKDVPPYIIEPGDELTVTFPDQKLKSLEGRWTGTASASVLNWTETGVKTVKATCQTDSWGNKISVHKSTLGAASDVPIRNLQAQVQIPYDPALAGKTLKLQVGMSVSYPTAAGYRLDWKKWSMTDTFNNKSARMSTSLVVHLAEPGQRRALQQAWKTGAAGGSAAYLFGGGILVLLAWSRSQRPRRDHLFA